MKRPEKIDKKWLTFIYRNINNKNANPDLDDLLAEIKDVVNYLLERDEEIEERLLKAVRQSDKYSYTTWLENTNRLLQTYK